VKKKRKETTASIVVKLWQQITQDQPDTYSSGGLIRQALCSLFQFVEGGHGCI